MPRARICKDDVSMMRFGEYHLQAFMVCFRHVDFLVHRCMMMPCSDEVDVLADTCAVAGLKQDGAYWKRVGVPRYMWPWIIFGIIVVL